MSHFEQTEGICRDLWFYKKKLKTERSMEIITTAIETIEYLATALDDAEDKIERMEKGIA